MRIKSVSAQNFRKYESFHADFNNINIIKGPNAIGKSTIKELIVWIFWGTDLMGMGRKDDILMREGATSMSGAAIVQMDDGTEHTIERIRNKKNQTLMLDGKKVSNERFEELFRSKETFLSMFVPGYFSSLQPKDGRAILATLLPEVSHEEVLTELLPEEAELLQDVKFAANLESVEYFLEQQRIEQKEIHTEYERMIGELRALQTILNNHEPKKPVLSIREDAITRYKANKVEIEKIEQQLADAQPNAVKKANLEAKINAMLKDYTQLKQQFKNTPSNNCSECGQSLPADKANQIKQTVVKFNKDLTLKMARIKQEGTRLREELESIQVVDLSESLNRLKELRAKVQAFEQVYHEEQRLMAAYKASLEAYNNAKTQYSSVEEDIVSQKHECEKIDAIVKAGVKYRIKYTEIQIKKLNQKFDKVKISLFKIAKETGEIQTDYKLTWNVRPYVLLSKSEKIRCDNEIGRVISETLGETYPVFIDDAEGVGGLFTENFNGQIFAAYFVPGLGTEATINGFDSAVEMLKESTKKKVS